MSRVYALMESEEAYDVISGYLTHYGFDPLDHSFWLEELSRIVALLRHMEDVLPAPLPGPDERPHPLYPERG